MNNSRKLLATTLVWLLLPFGILCSQTLIKGTVVDKNSGIPIEGATIQLKEGLAGTTTDIKGQFEIRTEQAFPIILSVSYIGFKAQEVLYQSDSPVRILLEQETYIGETIVVSASRKPEKESEAPASISVIESRSLETQALNNPGIALRMLAGVDVTQQGIDHFQITLRGRSDPFTTETYYMKDYRNLIVPGQATIALGRTSINELDMDRIEVVRGPGSALYGPGVETGVVHFISKSPIDYTGTSLSIGTGTQSYVSFAGRHAGRLSKNLGYKVLAHYNQADDFPLDPDDPIDAASLSAFQPQVTSSLTGEVLRTSNTLETKVSNYSLSAALEYRANDFTSWHLTGGYNQRRGIVRANLGEALQDFPSYFGQFRFKSKNFFAQFYVNGTIDDNEKNVLYRTGLTSISNNQTYQAQAQNDWELFDNKVDLSLGAEIQMIRTATQGTVHGRFEDRDAFDIQSAYAQSRWSVAPQLDIVMAARVDHFAAIEETVFSPRAGIVFQPLPTQSFRLTYNRANTAPSSLFIFGDILSGQNPAFDIPFLGGTQPIEFPDPLVTNSLIPGVGSYSGTDLPLAVPYGIALSSLQDVFSAEVLSYLSDQLGQVSMTTAGIPLLNGSPVSVLPERGKIRSTKTNAFEFGYKGVFNQKLAVGIDIYYNRRNDLVFVGPVSLLVVHPNLAADLSAELTRVTDPDELNSLGITQEAVVSAFSAVGEGLAANPLGLISPEVAYASSQPQFIVTPSNTGEVNYFGAEVSLKYYFNDRFSAFVNYSWLEQNLFNDKDIGLEGTGQVFSLNTPRNRLRLGADLIPADFGFSSSLYIRYQDETSFVAGTIFSGTLDSYTIIDASVGYAFKNNYRINLTAQNLFDQAYRVMPRMPKIGRLVLIKGVVDF